MKEAFQRDMKKMAITMEATSARSPPTTPPSNNEEEFQRRQVQVTPVVKRGADLKEDPWSLWKRKDEVESEDTVSESKIRRMSVLELVKDPIENSKVAYLLF